MKISTIEFKNERLTKGFVKITPKIVVQINNKNRYKKLFDNETKINVMTYDVIKTEGLIMQFFDTINLIIHIENTKTFMRMCENVKLKIENVIEYHNVFIIEAVDHKLVLKNSFLKQMNTQMFYQNDEVKIVMHQKNDVKFAVFIVNLKKKNAKRQKNLFFENRFEVLN